MTSLLVRYSEEYDISTDQSRSVAFDWTALANALEDIELYESGKLQLFIGGFWDTNKLALT